MRWCDLEMGDVLYYKQRENEAVWLVKRSDASGVRVMSLYNLREVALHYADDAISEGIVVLKRGGE